MKAFAVKKPCQGARTVSRSALIQFPHLIDIVDDLHVRGGPVDVLLGTDLPEVHHDYKVFAGNPEEPITKKNVFGWSVLGRIEKEGAVGVHFVEILDEEATNNDLKRLLFQDQVGIKPTRYCVCSEEEMRECAFIQQVKESTKVLEDGGIEVKMPWKRGHPNLPSSWSVAYQRMESKEKQLKKKGRLQAFNEEVRKLVDRDVVVKLHSSEVKPEDPAWYLPIREVETPDKTTKVRLVFDLAAKVDGVSLNDALEKGPCLLNSLFNVLIGWREEKIVFAGDIEKMFNQIALHPEDQKYHRFLWRDGDTSTAADIYQLVRLSFGDKEESPIKSDRRSTGPLPKSPERNVEQPSIIRSPKEEKGEERLVSAAVVTESNEDSKETIERILSRTLTLHKARRVVALTARAIQNFLHKEKITGPISATEYQETEKRLIRMVQVDMNVDSKHV